MQQDEDAFADPTGRYRIFQIFYDDASGTVLHPALIPLDNRDGPPDWFEFGAIVRYLRATDLDDAAWYGFLSPRFFDKLGLGWPDVKKVLDARPDADAALFSSQWHSLAKFRNPWVYGEVHHPGLIACSREFLRHRGEDADLESLVTDFDTSVLSNYVIAKPSFWKIWLELAEDYMKFVEAQGEQSPHRAKVVHRGTPSYEMKVFVQERLATWVLLNHPLVVTRPNYAFDLPLGRPTRSWLEPGLRRIINYCDRAKYRARTTGSSVPMLGFRIVTSANKLLQQ